MREYDHAEIERRQEEKWKKDDVYRSAEDTKKEKTYVLDMFPYPSGEGLHVGHPKGYIATDIYSRYKRMNGHAVLHPMGWDAFGLPAENFALKNKIHPRVAVEKNIAHFKDQLSHIGLDYDWSREINTTDPAYYKWTQWIFLKLLEHNLAFQSNEPINWCPSCMTGLANEDLDGNVCERCGTVVEKKSLPQWVLKITDYADRMLKDLDTLDWPEHIKEAQRNWIGRSEGAEVPFAIGTENITVFTTRPDTIFGATYLVLAPEHPLVEKLAPKNLKEVRTYAEAAAQKTEIDRSTEGQEKTGVKLEGVTAINPATKKEIPVYVADYVLASYGTGAVMGVPAHDERDFEFAKKFELPITQVVAPETGTKRENESVRKGGCAIIFDPKTQKYAALKRPNHFLGLCAGGVKEGEDPKTAILREAREEGGFHDFEHVELVAEAYPHYHNRVKNINVTGHAAALLIILKSADTVERQLEAHENFETVWATAKELRDDWLKHNDDGSIDHWLWFITHCVGRAIELGYDKKSDPNIFKHTAYTGSGILVNSGSFSGRHSEEAMPEIVEAIGGKKVVRYKLRDWIFSRQRYWGEPIPIIHCETDGAVPVPYEDLPVKLPEVKSYEPTGTGESPLAAITEWVNTTCPKCKGPAKRETNTMPQWAGSSWYYLRFMDPADDTQLVSGKREKYWGPVDVYVGGDHAVRHLIYARFWHKFLYDIGVVHTSEPFARLEFLGFILAEDGRKMSKRYGNVINPDDVVAEHGADAFRVYEMFMGPFENTTAWSTASIAGTSRFIKRVWQMQERVRKEVVPELETLLHQTVKKVGADIEAFKFNTAVSQLMIFVNAVEEAGKIGKDQWLSLLRLLAPLAPHVTEELWSEAGEEGSIHSAPWPTYDEALIVEAKVEVVVQVNGKRRGGVMLSADAPEGEALAVAKEIPAVATALAGKEPKRVVYVPGKILNLVA